MATVAEIYRRGYWDKCRCAELPEPFRLPLFDAAVNSGPDRSIKLMQSALGVRADGVMGPITMAAADNSPVPHLVAVDMIARRLEFLKGLRHWHVFGVGWSARLDSVASHIGADD